MQTVTAVRAGQTATFEVEGKTGWHRRPVPSDGILLETDTTTTFLPVAEAIAALSVLGYAVLPPSSEVLTPTSRAAVAPRKGKR